MPRVLLHLCCGPCSITVVRDLRAEGFEVTGLFYNPNIHPLREYLRRREAAQQAAERMDLPVIFKDADYDPVLWLRAVAHREANRCFHCYHLRLEYARAIAANGNFDYFSTTLLYSRHQRHDTIRDLGRDVAGPDAASDMGPLAGDGPDAASGAPAPDAAAPPKKKARRAPGFLYRDFRSGWAEGIETSKAWGLYRQQYCACLLSEFERYQGELKRLS
ncbi:MAG: epoxyqueuosine reductase QueH [Desulfovibrionaceae bacterium]|jgi:predicted adenine nucleotide alpha hydrolase (AANH) superfamily ATPase|nr:epoxyqueuosine reductase QueH [Desulfovibrionaceae bacterium]